MNKKVIRARNWCRDFPDQPLAKEEAFAMVEMLCSEIERYDRPRVTYQPFRCPVCGGTGLVPAGFYLQTMTSSATPEVCKTCKGSGAVWHREEG